MDEFSNSKGMNIKSFVTFRNIEEEGYYMQCTFVAISDTPWSKDTSDLIISSAC